MLKEVLFADDDPAMRQLVSDSLRAGGFTVRVAPDGRIALEEVRRAAPDLAVLDYRMGTPDGFDVCRAMKADPRLEHLPILILTGEGQIEHRVRAYEAGADDFLAKPFDPRELVTRCRALLRLTGQALDRNPNTGLPGGEALRRELDRRFEAGGAFSLCYLDLDHFKPFHDRFGFVIADEVIRAAGQALREAAEPGAFLGHVGGDDFILLTTAELAEQQVLRAQERFRELLSAHLPPELVAVGSYSGQDRDGHTREFPLTRLSAAIVHLDQGRPESLVEFSYDIAQAKQSAKQSSAGLAEVRVPPPLR